MDTTHELVRLAEHSLDLGLLPDVPVVLDVGCRGFEFDRQILTLRPKAQIVALDPDPTIVDPEIQGVTFLSLALVHTDQAFARYASYSTGEGNFLTELREYHDAKMLDVQCINIVPLMQQFGIKHWDLVKLDCEASEFGILENWPGPIATQISVEFHDFTDGERWDEAYYQGLWKKMPDYRVVRHEAFDTGYGHIGHWDSVLALKNA